MLTRRRTLQALLALPALAHGKAPSRLPEPDFERLASADAHQVGVRPHRLGGVRLELDRPLPGPKPLIHNYGHGGAGITLSLGCAERVAELVERALIGVPHQHPSVAILGTGVIGLTSADAIRRRHPGARLTVYASSLSLERTTSWVAAGQFEPSGVWREHRDELGRATLERWLQASRERIAALTRRWDALGIAQRVAYALDPPALLPSRRAQLPFERLDRVGSTWETWLLNPRRLLPTLRGDLVDAGVAFVERTFHAIEDVAALPQDVVVNCTGYGARALFRDDRVVGQRGHLVRLARPTDRHDYLFSATCGDGAISYVFCRQDDIVVGGTFVGGDDRATVLPEDEPVFRRLVANAAQVLAGRPERCVR